MGCRLNAFEADVMKAHVAAAGIADCVIVNTCAVTAEAVSQAGQTIRRLRRERPGARLIVTGCAAQLDPQRFAAIPGVDHVLGNAEKLNVHTFNALSRTNDRIAVGDIAAHHDISLPGRAVIASRTRAYVAIQNGCDHRCTFCIIPFARGPSRSVPAGDVVRHIAELVDLGTKEVVLTGVDVTSYGSDLPGEMSLGRLVKKILQLVPGLKRLRLSSIDQVEADRYLLDALANEERLMPHLHLSMQSGDDMILKRMKRRHTRQDAITFCDTARRLRPDVVFGADLIAGFPTETEEMFANTRDIVEACGLSFVHTFAYSRREGTPAARMPQVAGAIVKARAAALREVASKRLTAFLDRHQGREIDVLMERGGTGRTAQFAEAVIANPRLAGEFVRARVSSHDGRRLEAEVIGA
jgi:threonylcarbamoyladenosine tRNA methylthiotransferase MtaB